MAYKGNKLMQFNFHPRFRRRRLRLPGTEAGRGSHDTLRKGNLAVLFF